MSPLILLAIMAAAPVVLLMVLRVNAAIIFLSLCLGSVLVRFVARDAQQFANLFSTSELLSGYGISLTLLLAPAILTTIMMIGTVRGHFRRLLNILPALAVGLLAVLLAEPLLSPGLRGAIGATTAWHEIERAQDLVVGAGSLLSLLFLWLQRPKRESEKRGRARD